MQINILQSLIDRTSNQIAEYEACITYEKNAQASGWYEHADAELVQSNHTISYFKQRLPKVREIQKALKKEIAGKIRLQRGINHFNKATVERSKVEWYWEK